MIGLSNGNTNTSYADIDFAIDLAYVRQCGCTRPGPPRGTFGTYATGDMLRIAVIGGVVRYSRNGSGLLHSASTPLPAARRHGALHERSDPRLRSSISTCVDCALAGGGGCGLQRWGCRLSRQLVHQDGGDRMATPAPCPRQTIGSGDGYVEFMASETTTYRMVGLSNGNTDASYADIDFGIDLATGATVFGVRGRVSRGVPSAPTRRGTSCVLPSAEGSSGTRATGTSSTPPRRPDLPAARRHLPLHQQGDPQRFGRAGDPRRRSRTRRGPGRLGLRGRATVSGNRGRRRRRPAGATRVPCRARRALQVTATWSSRPPRRPPSACWGRTPLALSVRLDNPASPPLEKRRPRPPGGNGCAE